MFTAETGLAERSQIRGVVAGLLYAACGTNSAYPDGHRPLLLAALFLFHLGAALPSLQARHCRLQCLREKKKQPQGDGAVTSPGTFLPKLSSMGAKCRRGEMC